MAGSSLPRRLPDYGLVHNLHYRSRVNGNPNQCARAPAVFSVQLPLYQPDLSMREPQPDSQWENLWNFLRARTKLVVPLVGDQHVRDCQREASAANGPDPVGKRRG